MNTHYGVIMFSGDPDGEHGDSDLQGHSPSMTLICAGQEQFCWDSLATWTTKHPLRQWEDAEVLARDSSVTMLKTEPDKWKAIAAQLVRGGSHKPDCRIWFAPGCNCGWDEAHTAYESALGREQE